MRTLMGRFRIADSKDHRSFRTILWNIRPDNEILPQIFQKKLALKPISLECPCSNRHIRGEIPKKEHLYIYFFGICPYAFSAPTKSSLPGAAGFHYIACLPGREFIILHVHIKKTRQHFHAVLHFPYIYFPSVIFCKIAGFRFYSVVLRTSLFFST